MSLIEFKKLNVESREKHLILKKEYDRLAELGHSINKMNSEELRKIEDTVNEKIKENLNVHFEMLPLAKAKEVGAIGLFDDKYSDNVKVYFCKLQFVQHHVCFLYWAKIV